MSHHHLWGQSLTIAAPPGNQPTVSIALATYNGGRFIAEQLDSLLRQDYPIRELIVSDDNSSDDTLKILEQRRAETVKVYRNETNLGYIKNFEKACRLCSGDYIALCDQDDIWSAEKISVLINEIVKADALAIFSDAYLIDDSGRMSEAGLWDAVLEGAPVPSPIDFRAFYLNNCVTGCTLLFKKELLQEVLPFSGAVPHDWWIAYHAAYRGGLVCCTNKLVRHRQHGNNAIGLSHGIREGATVTTVFRRAIEEVSLRDRLRRHAKWHAEIEARLRAYWDFETSGGRQPTRELALLCSWITARGTNQDLSAYGRFFTSQESNPVFALFGRSVLSEFRQGAMRSEGDIRRRFHRKMLGVALTLMVVLVLAGVYLL